MSADAAPPPPYSTETDRAQDIARVSQLTLALSKQLDLLPNLLVKIDKSVLEPVDKQTLESLQTQATLTPSTYGNDFVIVRQSTTDVEYRVQRFLQRVDMIHDPNAKKSDLISAFTTFINGTNFDPELLKQYTERFEDIAGKVNDMANQSANFVFSAVKGVIAKRNVIDDDARSQKAHLRELEKKLADLPEKKSSLLQRSNDEERKKLKQEIAETEAKIKELDARVAALFDATAAIRDIGDKFNSETTDIMSSLRLGPKQIASTLAKVVAQVKLDATALLYAIEHDMTITEVIISDAKGQYNHIASALNALATK